MTEVPHRNGVSPEGREMILASLEADQLVAAKVHRLGRLRLSGRVKLLLWALRLYVLAMLAIVVYVVLRS
ncbi:MAG: hypothetical protein ACRD2H_16555 [Terriglobales bacterium]